MPEQRPAVCPLDCPDTCNPSVTVQDGKLLKVRGSNANPLTQGKICAKVTCYPVLVHGTDRLQIPLRRTGAKGSGEFEVIDWPTALNTIHQRFSAAIAPHGAGVAFALDMRFALGKTVADDEIDAKI